MATSRYVRDPVLGMGQQLGTAQATNTIRAAIKSGLLGAGRQYILRGAERLDTIAGEQYGSSRYWWVIAAASNIGWGMQCPAGTVLNIPTLSDVLKLIG